ncbi:glycosyltransferase involved in cell wall biosynthesis [Bradyrhizobium sp. GM2.2]|uniref:glycosyltransferase n=1 Tax=Bradyrhizobium sp. GM2.2 TaxID=3156358 RepID=UPI003399554E
MKLKIAHVISRLSPERGGTTVAVMEIARWQALLGHQCTILTAAFNGDPPPAGLFDRLLKAGGSVLEFKTLGSEKLQYMPDLRRYLDREGRSFDLFVVHGPYQYPYYAVSRFCRQTRIPYLFTPHGSLDPAVRGKHSFRNRLVDLVYNDSLIGNASAWHFTSEEERIACERPIWKRSFVESLGIDVDSVPERRGVGEFRAKYGIPTSAPFLLFLSRITSKKGIDILLEAFRRVLDRHPNVFLALCGPIDPDMRGLIRAAQADPSLADHLAVTGLILGEEKDSAFIDCDCFVLPTYSENFGIAVFEALAYGRPVLTTTGMNLHAELSASGRALIVKPDADSLYRGLESVVSGEWRPSATEGDARLWLEENFSWRRRAEKLSAHYVNAVRPVI